MLNSSCRFALLSLGLSLLLMMGAGSLFAGPSSIAQRTSYTSEKQQLYSFEGNWGFDEKIFARMGLNIARFTEPPVKGVDSYFQITPGAGYSFDNLALGGGMLTAYSPLSHIFSIGGYGCLTYIHLQENTDPEEQRDQALNLLHNSAFYAPGENEQFPNSFWGRATFESRTMHSKLAPSGSTDGGTTAFSLEAYYPWSERLLLGGGFSVHSYIDNLGFFAKNEKIATDIYSRSFGTTLQDLPKLKVHLEAAWRIAARDLLLPRYQISQLYKLPDLAHTIDIGWRHQFSKQWFLTPTYELSTQSGQTTSGLILDLLLSI